MVILGLGANLGNRAIHLKRAVSRLSRGCEAVLHGVKLSRIYESPALTPSGAPAAWDLPYLNCALSGETTLEPGALLRRVKEIERSLGRRDHERWAPRVIDIDILWWDGNEVRSDGLTIPHPEILRRPFVLEPLRDLYRKYLQLKHAHVVEDDAGPAPANLGRRRALDVAISVLGVVTGVGLLWPAVAYVLPARRRGGGADRVSAGSAEDWKAWEVRKVAVGGRPVSVLRTDKGFRAMSAICTHLGCIVHWNEKKKTFDCPCHAASFDPAGQVVAGPPPGPLAQYGVSEVQGEVIVTGPIEA